MIQTIKEICISGLVILALLLGSVSHADERTEIDALIKEMDYLIEVAQAMQTRYGRTKSRVTFNYAALLQQLRATRSRTAEFLNSKGEVINREPPRTLESELIRIK